MAMNNESFKSEKAVAEFLSKPVRKVLELTRRGIIRGYPIPGAGNLRHEWVYRLSEVAEDITALRKPVGSIIRAAAPVSQTRRSSNG
jgi:hypothetical protein